jgi:hypothetical protein
MRILDAFRRWLRRLLTAWVARVSEADTRGFEASPTPDAAPEPVSVPLTPEQQADQDLRAWQCKWLRYMRIRRGGAEGVGDLEVAWRQIAPDSYLEDVVRDPAAWKLRALGDDDIPARDSPHRHRYELQRKLILADIDFLIADTTVAPPPDEDPAPRECRSAEAATFGDYLNRW